jgi:hypothetical protein
MAASYAEYYSSKGVAPTPAVFAVRISNTGTAVSGCVVLGFLLSNHTNAPKQRLFDFSRIEPLPPGGSVMVQLSVPAPVLAIADDAGAEHVLPGGYEVLIRTGDLTESVVRARLELTGAPQTISTFPTP